MREASELQERVDKLIDWVNDNKDQLSRMQIAISEGETIERPVEFFISHYSFYCSFATSARKVADAYGERMLQAGATAHGMLKRGALETSSAPLTHKDNDNRSDSKTAGNERPETDN